MKVEEINPYDPSREKAHQVEEMFNTIAPRYDLMNAGMSLGQHKRWRNKALKAAISQLPDTGTIDVLDVATGTGDVAFKLHDLLPEAQITGIDLSEGMLEIARAKLHKSTLQQQKLMAFGKGDSLSLPFHDNTFSLVTAAYGVRNFQNLRKGIEEMKRVLLPGGVLCIIELSCPDSSVARVLYNLYSGKIIPIVGKMVTGDTKAYSYLPQSIAACPQRDDMAALLYGAGFTHVEWHSLSLGVLTYYIAR